MIDLERILPLWRELVASGTEYVLATVVEVEGSGYRKPGARMLISIDGRRAGTISGGCLEADVAKKAFWHTEKGPVIRRFSTRAEDGDVPFGMGCGGVIYLLLERSKTAGPLLSKLAACFSTRTSIAIATILDGPSFATRAFYSPSDNASSNSNALAGLAQKAFENDQSFTEKIYLDSAPPAKVWAEFCPARPGLHIFGAGDDAIPLVKIARTLGWFISVSDGRSHLATTIRFPDADEVHVLPQGTFPPIQFQLTDAAVSMTHSLQQDTHVLRTLVSKNLSYIGVLGPRTRTIDILESLAQENSSDPVQVKCLEQDWLTRIHAPMGLDLGAETPSAIALSIIAEIQQTFRKTTGLPLHRLRARKTQEPITLVS